MPWPLFKILLILPVFALVLFRLGGFILSAPLFSSSVVPKRIRIALALAISAMMVPVLSSQVTTRITLSQAILGGAGELLIGLSIGLALTALLSCAQVAGLVVGQQAGIALGNVFDPTQNQTVTTVGQIYTIVLIFMFLLAGGHRAAMAALLDTYEVMPIMSTHANEPMVLLLVEMISAAFIVGIRLAGPVLIALFLTAIAMGFLSRTMPQLNILSVGFTVRALVALGVAGLALTHCSDMLLNAVWEGLSMVRETYGLDLESLRLMT